MADNAKQLWNGRPILHEQHAAELDQAAAIGEFQHGMPRQEAEHKAYQAYRKTQHEKAAAWHLRGLKAAQGSGDLDAAKTHGAMYSAHMEKLGHEPWKEVPPEIKVHLEAPEKERAYKFKATGADSFVLDDHKVQPTEPIAKSLHKLYHKATAALEVLQKARPFPAKPLPEKDPYIFPKDRSRGQEEITTTTRNPPTALTPMTHPQLHAVVDAMAARKQYLAERLASVSYKGYQFSPDSVEPRRAETKAIIDQARAGIAARGGLLKASSVPLRQGQALAKAKPNAPHPHNQVLSDQLQEQQGFVPDNVTPQGIGQSLKRKRGNVVRGNWYDQAENDTFVARLRHGMSGSVAESEPVKKPGKSGHDPYWLNLFWDLSAPPSKNRVFDTLPPGDFQDGKYVPFKQPYLDQLWSGYSGKPPLNKSWPKNDAENHDNANVHAVMEDSMYEQGAVRQEIKPSRAAAKPYMNHSLDPTTEAANQNMASQDEWDVKEPAKTYLEPGPAEHLDRRLGANAWSKPFKKESLSQDKKFWESIGRAVGLNKSWPKDDNENKVNTEANAVFQDHAMESGKPFSATKKLNVQARKIQSRNRHDPATADRISSAEFHNVKAKDALGLSGPSPEPGPSGIEAGDLENSKREGVINDNEFWHSLGRAVGIQPNRACVQCGASTPAVARTVDPEARLIDGTVEGVDLCPDCYDELDERAYEEDHSRDDDGNRD